MSNDDDDFFDRPERKPAASPRFAGRKGEVGDSVTGVIVDRYKVDETDFSTKKPILDEKTGKTRQQTVLVLQTDHRNWDNTSKVPTRKEGDKEVPIPADEDTGLRLLFVSKAKNIYGAILDAIIEAIPDREARKGHPRVGSKLFVQFYDEEDTGKGNPLKKFRAKYKPGEAPVEDNFAETEQKPATTSEPEPPKDPWATTGLPGLDEPPF